MTELTQKQARQRLYTQKRKETHTTLIVSKELRNIIKSNANTVNLTIEKYLTQLVTLWHKDLALFLKINAK